MNERVIWKRYTYAEISNERNRTTREVEVGNKRKVKKHTEKVESLICEFMRRGNKHEEDQIWGGGCSVRPSVRLSGLILSNLAPVHSFGKR